MYRVHDVDDTTAFLAAARSLRLGRSKYTSASSPTGNADTEAGTNVDADADAFGDSTAPGKVATDTGFDAKDSDDVAAGKSSYLLSLPIRIEISTPDATVPP